MPRTPRTPRTLSKCFNMSIIKKLIVWTELKLFLILRIYQAPFIIYLFIYLFIYYLL